LRRARSCGRGRRLIGLLHRRDEHEDLLIVAAGNDIPALGLDHTDDCRIHALSMPRCKSERFWMQFSSVLKKKIDDIWSQEALMSSLARPPPLVIGSIRPSLSCNQNYGQ
jgi:hypothetical protein